MDTIIPFCSLFFTYIRCIRPNANKQPKNFDVQLCTNQIRYLGLQENVRVRRAGFVYRQTFERFLHRYVRYYFSKKKVQIIDYQNVPTMEWRAERRMYYDHEGLQH